MPNITNKAAIIPDVQDFEKILTAKLSYEAQQHTPQRDAWNKKHFTKTPWGIAYNVSKAKLAKTSSTRTANNQQGEEALKYLIIAIAIDWQELIDQLKRTLKNWGYTSAELQQLAKDTWLEPSTMAAIANACGNAKVTKLIEDLNTALLTESVEKHAELNKKLFNKDGTLKASVRSKMLEIVDEFITNLKEQDIKLKVTDILFIGSNASYNYTANSDIDLHILADTDAADYPEELGNALYSAYRSLFNKQLDIEFFGIPVELFVETESSKRVSNGIYSVKTNKWLKMPVQEAIPDYDKKALSALVSQWETKYEKLIKEVESGKVSDEKKVVKLLTDIYDKLRKKGIAKDEYSIENLTFKELRNKGYLDKLKDYKNDLTSKRLSLEERFNRRDNREMYNQIARITGSQPIIQDNGMFFVYNLKESDVQHCVRELRKLPFVVEVSAYDSGKFDFHDVLRIATHNLPAKYYNIRGRLEDTTI